MTSSDVRRRVALILSPVLLAGVTSAASAQGEDSKAAPASAPYVSALYVSAQAMQHIADSAPVDAATGRPGGFSKRLFTAPNYSDSYIRIAAPDKPHAHGKWSEVYVILSGSAVLETGGTILGAVEGNSAVHGALFLDPKQAALAAAPAGPATTATRPPAEPGAPRDLAGTDIAGGTRQVMKAGDIILIPAGVPHRWFSVDVPVVYQDIKFPR